MLDIVPIAKSLLRNKTAAFLIVIQLALSVAIISNALFFINQRIDKINRPTGMAVNEIFKLWVKKKAENTDLEYIVKRDMDIIRAMPGVIDAVPINSVPLSGGGNSSGFRLSTDGTSDSINGNTFQLTEHGIKTLGLKLVEGRNFYPDEIKYVNRNDRPTSIQVIVTKKFADKAFPNESALGNTVFVGGDIVVNIIGIVERMMGSWPNDKESRGVVFYPRVNISDSLNYLIRTNEQDRDEIMLKIIEKLRSIDDSRLVVYEQKLEDIMKDTYSSDYAMIKILSVVVFMLIVVNALGIVGLTTFWVNQRRKQIGIRRALGATKTAITSYFIVENGILCFMAIAVGGALALTASDYMVRNYSLNILPWQYVPVTGLCILVLTMLAAFVPALRAAKISPAEATA